MFSICLIIIRVIKNIILTALTFKLYILHLSAKCIYLKNCIAAKFCFFKMSDESKHSDSKFYYPGKLSYAALLQLPTYSECTVRKSILLTNEEVHKMVIL